MRSPPVQLELTIRNSVSTQRFYGLRYNTLEHIRVARSFPGGCETFGTSIWNRCPSSINLNLGISLITSVLDNHNAAVPWHWLVLSKILQFHNLSSNTSNYLFPKECEMHWLGSKRRYWKWLVGGRKTRRQPAGRFWTDTNQILRSLPAWRNKSRSRKLNVTKWKLKSVMRCLKAFISVALNLVCYKDCIP